MRRWFGALVGLLVLAGVLAVAPAGSAVTDPERGSVADLVVAASVPGVLAVSWTPPTNPAGAVPTDYRVRWAAVGDPFLTWSDLSGNAFPNAVSLDIGDLTVGTAYRVQVRARYRSGRFESAAWSGPWAESDPATVTDTYTPSVVLEGSMGVEAGRHGGGAMYGYAKWGSGTGTPVGTFDAPGVKALVRLDGTHDPVGPNRAGRPGGVRIPNPPRSPVHHQRRRQTVPLHTGRGPGNPHTLRSVLVDMGQPMRPLEPRRHRDSASRNPRPR